MSAFSLELRLALVLTQEEYTQGGWSMNEHNSQDSSDSKVDARAALALILIAVSTALMWVSQQ